MATSVPFSPYATTTAAGQFYTTSDGFVAGMAVADPVARFNLSTGVLASTETLPMWGGVGICENIPLATTDGSLGGTIARAIGISTTGATGALTGFSTSDQMYAWVTTPQSIAPSIGTGGVVGYYRFRSNARLVLPCAPALVNFDGSPVSQQASWDFTAQQLVPFVAAYPANVITAATWANTNGGQATLTTTSAHGLSVGSVFDITGITPAAYNGQFTAITGTTGSTIVYALPLATTPGAGTVFGTLVAGGGAVPGMILQTQAAGNKTIVYNSANGAVNYVNSGAVAVFLLN